MQRIRQRRYGRDGNSPHATGASHVIKIGFDARKAGATRPLPGKLRGFLLCKDTLDQNNMLVVDMAAMRKLGATPESIEQARKLQLKAPVGLLPSDLHFVLTNDAKRIEGQWVYPGIFAEEYETWGKLGRFCHGDGVHATRRQEDGTRQEIACVPKGKDGTAAKEWCPFSVQGDCRARSRLVLCLFVPDPKTGRPMPMDESLGWEARFRFDTSSEYNPMRFLAALDAAAERLNGQIAGIPGTLSFMVQRKRTGNEAAPVGIVGQVQLSLSEHEIAKREREMFTRQLESQRMQALSANPGAALPEHEPDTPSSEMPEEEEPVYVMGTDMPDGFDETGYVEVDPDEGDVSDGDEEDTPDGPNSEPDDLRSRAINARDILLRAFPDAQDAMGFELNTEFGVDSIEKVRNEDLEQAISILREIYKGQDAKRGAVS